MFFTVYISMPSSLIIFANEDEIYQGESLTDAMSKMQESCPNLVPYDDRATRGTMIGVVNQIKNFGPKSGYGMELFIKQEEGEYKLEMSTENLPPTHDHRWRSAFQ